MRNLKYTLMQIHFYKQHKVLTTWRANETPVNS
jgi:hypothetical protein